MKLFEFAIDEFDAKWMFSPLRNKRDVILLLMRTIKFILTFKNSKRADPKGMLVLSIDKMSRIFFESNNKIFSVNFPYVVKSDDDGIIEVVSKYGIDVDNKFTSDVITFVNEHPELGGDDIYKFVDTAEQSMGESDEVWLELRKLFLFEDGYIRYDYDEEHENGDMHPRNHFDVFYSSSNTFKIGLRGRVKREEFMSFLNVNTDCRYLE